VSVLAGDATEWATVLIAVLIVANGAIAFLFRGRRARSLGIGALALAVAMCLYRATGSLAHGVMPAAAVGGAGVWTLWRGSAGREGDRLSRLQAPLLAGAAGIASSVLARDYPLTGTGRLDAELAWIWPILVAGLLLTVERGGSGLIASSILLSVGALALGVHQGLGMAAALGLVVPGFLTAIFHSVPVAWKWDRLSPRLSILVRLAVGVAASALLLILLILRGVQVPLPPAAAFVPHLLALCLAGVSMLTSARGAPIGRAFVLPLGALVLASAAWIATDHVWAGILATVAALLALRATLATDRQPERIVSSTTAIAAVGTIGALLPALVDHASGGSVDPLIARLTLAILLVCGLSFSGFGTFAVPSTPSADHWIAFAASSLGGAAIVVRALELHPWLLGLVGARGFLELIGVLLLLLGSLWAFADRRPGGFLLAISAYPLGTVLIGLGAGLDPSLAADAVWSRVGWLAVGGLALVAREARGGPGTGPLARATDGATVTFVASVLALAGLLPVGTPPVGSDLIHGVVSSRPATALVIGASVLACIWRLRMLGDFWARIEEERLAGVTRPLIGAWILAALLVVRRAAF